MGTGKGLASMDLSGTPEAAKVSATAQELDLGRFSVGTAQTSAAQEVQPPRVGGETEPAPQEPAKLVTAGQAK